MLKGVAHLWKNKGVEPMRELLYIFILKTENYLDFENGFGKSSLPPIPDVTDDRRIM